MASRIDWPDGKDKAPVFLRMENGAEEILKDGLLSTYIKSAVVKTLGVMLDADTAPVSRYESIRNRCSSFFPAMPNSLPPGGLIVANDDGKRLGVWIMPDNSSAGSLETFLRYLVPNLSEPIWKSAVDAVTRAKELGCPCRDAHLAKAHLYTWLAWQDPPNQNPGHALTQKVLDPHNGYANAFVTWFRQLYEI